MNPSAAHADVEAAWAKVVERWDDVASHEKLMIAVAKHSAFAWAAARYKERAGDATADKQLERIRKAATATLFASASTKRPEDPPYKRTIVIFAVMLIMLVVGLIGVKLMHDIRSEPPPPPPPTTHGSH